MAGGKQKAKAPCQPDTFGKGFFGFPRAVIASAAYRDLSVHARAILIELGARSDGYNNGRIAADQRSLREALRCSPRKIVTATAELMEHGFIDVAIEAQWSEKLAREYRLTFVSTRTSRATNDYVRWQPGKQNGATYAVAETPFPATAAVAEVETPDTHAVAEALETPLVSVEPTHVSATEAVVHLSKPSLAPDRGQLDGKKQGGNSGGPIDGAPDSATLDALRARLRTYLDDAPSGSQTRLAAAAKIPGGTLSKYLDGRGLSAHHFVNLQLALATATRKDAA